MLSGLSDVRAEEPSSVLIEAEDWQQRIPDDDSFAFTFREEAASGRQVLTRFSGEGECHYQFSLPEAGNYRLWIRYAANSSPVIRFLLDGEPGATPDRTRLEPTGGISGEGAWGWGQIFEGDLSAGQHLLKVFNVPLRPDCYFFTKSTEEPDDSIIRTTPVVRIDPETRALLEKPISPIRPDWLDEVQGYELPEWYDAHRVHLHTRLSLPYRKRTPEVFLTAGELAQKMGAHVLIRHLKGGGEGAWWPTEYGETDSDAADIPNLGQFVIDEAHDHDLRLIAYYRHMEDWQIAEEHPDWVSLNANGEPYKSRGPKICFNSPYADFVEHRLLELVDLGADGLYFDEVHMEKSGCWCDFCQKQFKEASGLKFPERPDPFDPLWLKLVEFTNASMERTFLKWREAVHARNPEVVMLIGSHSWPGMTERHMNNRLFRIADATKTEFATADRAWPSDIFPVPDSLTPLDREVRVSLGYVLSRDASDGRPAHMWVNGLPASEPARFAAAGVLAHGCIANLDVPEPTMPNPEFEAALKLGDAVSSALAGTRPVPWAMLHYPEAARDQFLLTPDKSWPQLLYPFYRAYAVLHELGVPVCVITDSQLAEGVPDECRMLFLPGPDSLTPEMQTSVDAFSQRGGQLVKNSTDWQWGPEDGSGDADFRNAVTPVLPAAPVQVTGGPSHLHSGVFQCPGEPGAFVVTLANSFTWVNDAIHAARESDGSPSFDLPASCEGVEIHFAEKPVGEVKEVISGETLEVVSVADGQGWSVSVPAFDAMAVVVVSE